MRIFTILTVFLLNINAWAGRDSSGLSVHLDFGNNQTDIQTGLQEAKYQGLDLVSRVNIPLLRFTNFSTRLNLGYKWAQLNNRSTSSSGAETGNHSGPMGGIEFRVVNIFLGANYSSLQAKHISSVTPGQSFDFNYTPIDVYGGIDFALSDDIRLGVMYNQVMATDVDVSGQSWKLSSQIIKIGLSFPTSFSFIEK